MGSIAQNSDSVTANNPRWTRPSVSLIDSYHFSFALVILLWCLVIISGISNRQALRFLPELLGFQEIEC